MTTTMTIMMMTSLKVIKMTKHWMTMVILLTMRMMMKTFKLAIVMKVVVIVMTDI